MSINSDATRKAGPYTASGSSQNMPFTFKVFANTDVLVKQVDLLGIETTLVLTTDYTVTLNADQDNSPGGYITITKTAGYLITIGSQVPATQGVVVTNNGGFYPTVLNTALDKVTILVQQLKEVIGRTLTLPFSASSSVSTTLPFPQANKVIGWSGDGLSLANFDPASLATSVIGATRTTLNFTTTSGSQSYPLGVDPLTINNVTVIMGGVGQPRNTYSLSGSGTSTNLVITAPSSGIALEVTIEQGVAYPVTTLTDGAVTTAKLVNGAVPRAKMDTAYAASIPDSTSVQAAAAKATPVDADLLTIWDSASSFVLSKLTWANLKATLKTYFDTLYMPTSASISPPIRQTVLSGPVDTNGSPSFGGSTGATTVTASGTLKATCFAGGDANYSGSITNPSWTGLSTNGTMYLFLDITSGGVVTTASATVVPVTQPGGTPAVTNGLLTVNYQEGKCYLGNGSTAPQAYRVAVGEVTVSGGVVTAITWYALMGRYTSPWTTTLPSAGSAVSVSHNIGAVQLRGRMEIQCTSAENGYSVGDIVEPNGNSGNPERCWYQRNTGGWVPAAGGNLALLNKSTGSAANLTNANWQYRTIFERTW